MFIYSSGSITYSLGKSASLINEGQSVTFTLTTTGIPNGTNIPYTATGISAADLSSGNLTGNFTISNNTATTSFTLANDFITEGTETLTLSLNNGKAISNVTVVDTSVPIIAKSLSFTRTSGQYLSRVWGSTGTSQKNLTFSLWAKRSETSVTYHTLMTDGFLANTFGFGFTTTNTIYVSQANGGSSYNSYTNATYTDTNYHHIVYVIDTTNATSTDRFKFYIDNTRINSFSSVVYPTQNYNVGWNNVSYPHRIGSNTSSNPFFFDGYIADVYVIDGQSLNPSYFAGLDGNSQWKPKPYSGSGYGTNGFHLNFSNGTSTTTLGSDSSGNGNNWTLNSMTTTNQTTVIP